jgi:hypothetical protein
MKNLILLLLFLILHTVVIGQEYSLEINQQEVNFGSNKKLAFCTAFQLPQNIVKKEWWKYIKRYAMLSNKKTHYENKILAKKSQAADDIYFFSQLNFKNEISTLKIALNDSEVDKSDIALYNQYLKDLMLDFKVAFYSSQIQSKIDQNEKISAKVSSRIEKFTRNNLKLASSKKKKKVSMKSIENKINANNQLIEKARIELFAYQSEMNGLKKELEGIK